MPAAHKFSVHGVLPYVELRTGYAEQLLLLLRTPGQNSRHHKLCKVLGVFRRSRAAKRERDGDKTSGFDERSHRVQKCKDFFILP